VTTENTSAISVLFADVKAYVASKNAGTEVVFGRKERWMQINQGTNGANRICFVPGNVDDGSDGELVGVDGPGETIVDGKGVARALHLQGRIYTVSLWAADTTNDPSASVDELAQEEAIQQMFEWLQRAIRRSIAGAANVAYAKPRHNNRPNELKFGVEYLVDLEVGTQFFDDVPGVIQASGVAVSRGSITASP